MWGERVAALRLGRTRCAWRTCGWPGWPNREDARQEEDAP